MQIKSERNDYIIDFSIFFDSVLISIDDENCLNCKFFSLEIDIEPSLAHNIDYIENSNVDEFMNNYDFYLNENESNTRFQTKWFQISELPLKTTFDIFYSDHHQSIRECTINQSVKCSSILPSWMIDIYTNFYNNLNTSRSFNDFLLSVIQLRITILGFSRSNHFEISQIGECLIKLNEDQLLSSKNFLFINKIHESSFVLNINDSQIDNFTIGVLKCFFEYIPTISEISSNPNKNYSYETSSIFECRFSRANLPSGNKNPKHSNITIKEHIMDNCDFIPLQWEYLDDNGKVRGPYNSIIIMSWVIKGYFSNTSKLRLFSAGNSSSDNETHSKTFTEFRSLSEHIELIKSDVSRLFPNSEKNLQYKLSQTNSSYRLEDKSYQGNSTYSSKTQYGANKLTDKHYIDSTKNGRKAFFMKEIEEIESIKEQLMKIETEFHNKIKKKPSECKDETENIFCTNPVDKNLSKRDQVIEFATRNVFRQRNNFTFKRWCAEFGSDLVSEACAIRIQRTFRKYKRRKNNTYISNVS
ncbi:hypothetical protein RS030_213432 [Cryptosporidium xiaoi]|uniref:GYF domain-containing protein n=1 Tax=Cryptosporidium xiaoi TaxID=659607 RepID=A0AAV9XYQ0_9CRYT